MPNKSGPSEHFTFREATPAQRRVYFRQAAVLSEQLGGINALERALGVTKGTLYKRGYGKIPLKYESILAMDQLHWRVIQRNEDHNVTEG